MKPSFIFTSDIHLTDIPRDEYRWGIFDILRDFCSSTKGQTDIIIGGDLTQAKDRHPSRMVNRMVASFERLVSECQDTTVHIVCGNHDFVDPAYPFFDMLGCIPGVHFYKESASVGPYTFLPYTKDITTWDLDKVVSCDTEYIFTHQTMHGSLASNGMPMQGLSDSVFDCVPKTVKILAGDIHVPQTIGRVEYVGSPYHIYFGDDFVPRVMRYERGERLSGEETSFINKYVVDFETIEEFEEAVISLDIQCGDQVKARVLMHHRDISAFADIKTNVTDICDHFEFDLASIELQVDKTTDRVDVGEAEETDKSVFDRFTAKDALEEPRIAIGRAIMGDI